jgi:hypothetical protein
LQQLALVRQTMFDGFVCGWTFLRLIVMACKIAPIGAEQ